jgi:hypothetical protein
MGNNSDDLNFYFKLYFNYGYNNQDMIPVVEKLSFVT